MQDMCFGPECTISGYRSCKNGFTPKASMLLHWTQNDVWECFGAFRKPSEFKKMQNLCFGPECTISGYRSCENGVVPNASILLHWTQNDVWECFGAFRKPLTCKKMQNLWFRPKCTISGHQSCENGFVPKALILLHWSQNDVCKCFGPFRKPSECKTIKNLCFEPECTNSGYRSHENGFAPNASVVLHWTKNDV